MPLAWWVLCPGRCMGHHHGDYEANRKGREMKKSLGMRVGWMGGVVLATSMAYAVDITVNDPHDDKKISNGSRVSYNATPLHENGTVEFNAVSTHEWDLQSFDLTGGKLGMTAGFNFTTAPSGYPADVMGDVFIFATTPYEVNRTSDGIRPDPLKPGTLQAPLYAVKFERNSAGGYKVVSGQIAYQIIANPTVLTTGSNPSLDLYYGLPWEAGGAFGTPSGYADYTSSGSGSTFENTVSGIDVGSYLTSGDYLHITMKCGNDVMWGHVPDGGMTLAMLGMGVGGLALVNRRLRR